MNIRRTLTLALAAAALVTSFTSLAQQPAGPADKVWRVGFLAADKRPASIDAHFHGAFARGMRELGYVEGKNLTLEYRSAENRPELLDVLAAELVKMKVDVMVILGSPPTQAAQRATSTIPLVFVGPGDPVRIGLVKSLARPGGNITGVSNNTNEISGKRLQLLLEMTAGVAPKVSRVAVLTNPHTPANSLGFEQVRVAAAKTLGITIVPVEAQDAAQIDAAFARMRGQNAGALFVFLNPLFQQRSAQIAELAAKFRLPSMTGASVYPEAGCLMSYGTSLYEQFRRAAYFVDRIFKGAKPADLPFEQPTKFELVINARTAKALGLAIPQALLISADKVIE